MDSYDVVQHAQDESMTGESGWMRCSIRDRVGALVLFFLIAVLLFADVLFMPGDRVLSRVGVDLSNEFLGARAFGFGELLRGNIALWNPHLFGGQPFMADFQSGLFYPTNLIFLVLALGESYQC